MAKSRITLYPCVVPGCLEPTPEAGMVCAQHYINGWRPPQEPETTKSSKMERDHELSALKNLRDMRMRHEENIRNAILEAFDEYKKHGLSIDDLTVELDATLHRGGPGGAETHVVYDAIVKIKTYL